MVIVVRSVSHEGNDYYHHVLLDECLYKMLMLEYGKIDVSKEIDVTKPMVYVEALFVITGTFLR